ncbi:hypothetical protein V5P93_006768 [Actinokineospora auranticolor]|uniref:Uncharacterized protein n=1 Tax=Actinokineospora auranticolor TaxID=155976 RepID=A0A2S6GWK8_9PSEU|nr:hypothetical protein [Actinokineospora auranticolor]PPK69587.1 hypothetical protein CLV40_103197 [Actinokineospora auranticolor]
MRAAGVTALSVGGLTVGASLFGLGFIGLIAAALLLSGGGMLLAFQPAGRILATIGAGIVIAGGLWVSVRAMTIMPNLLMTWIIVGLVSALVGAVVPVVLFRRGVTQGLASPPNRGFQPGYPPPGFPPPSGFPGPVPPQGFTPAYLQPGYAPQGFPPAGPQPGFPPQGFPAPGFPPQERSYVQDQPGQWPPR